MAFSRRRFASAYDFRINVIIFRDTGKAINGLDMSHLFFNGGDRAALVDMQGAPNATISNYHAAGSGVDIVGIEAP